jgi:hypothetical protein
MKQVGVGVLAAVAAPLWLTAGVAVAPQNGHQGRYSPSLPPQVVLLTVTAGARSDAGIICQMR